MGLTDFVLPRDGAIIVLLLTVKRNDGWNMDFLT